MFCKYQTVFPSGVKLVIVFSYSNVFIFIFLVKRNSIFKKWNLDIAKIGEITNSRNLEIYKNNILDAYFNSPSKGFNTEIEGKNILYWSDIFTKLSKEGLKSRNKLNSKKSNETIYLKNLDKMIIKKSTKAEDSIKNLTK